MQTEMERVVERDGRALRRIVALLVALAQIADRAGSIPFPVRVIVLAILRRAEIVAWAFAFGTASVPTARGPKNRHQTDMTPPGALVEAHRGPADAARLADSLRLLALIIANWATSLEITAMPSTVRLAISAKRACSSGTWRGPAALLAPDTS
jgi:hypothetical protein